MIWHYVPLSVGRRLLLWLLGPDKKGLFSLGSKGWNHLPFGDFWEFHPVSLFCTNNILLFSQTKFISSKHTCSPTTPVNIRIAYLTVLYLWHHKIGKNLIFCEKQNIASILRAKRCVNRKKLKVHFLWGYNRAFISSSPSFHIS